MTTDGSWPSPTKKNTACLIAPEGIRIEAHRQQTTDKWQQTAFDPHLPNTRPLVWMHQKWSELRLKDIRRQKNDNRNRQQTAVGGMSYSKCLFVYLRSIVQTTDLWLRVIQVCSNIDSDGPQMRIAGSHLVAPRPKRTLERMFQKPSFSRYSPWKRGAKA